MFSLTDLCVLIFLYVSHFSLHPKEGFLLLSYATSLRITWEYDQCEVQPAQEPGAMAVRAAETTQANFHRKEQSALDHQLS